MRKCECCGQDIIDYCGDCLNFVLNEKSSTSGVCSVQIGVYVDKADRLDCSFYEKIVDERNLNNGA